MVQRHWEHEPYIGCRTVKPSSTYLRNRKTGHVYQFGYKYWEFTQILLEDLKQTFLDTNPIPVTYASLGVLSSVQADPYTGSPSGIATSVNDLLGSSTYAATVLTHKDNFQTHITNDTKEYESLEDKLYRYVKANAVTR